MAGWNGSRSSATSRPGGVARLVPGTGELVEPLVPGFYWGVDSAEDGGGLATQAELVDLSPGVANGESYVDWRGIRASIGIQFGGFTFTRFALVGDHLVWQAGSTALGWNNQACTQPGHLFFDGSAYCGPDWRTSLPGVLTGPAALGTDAVVYGVAAATHEIAVLDATTGAVRFTGPVPNGVNLSLSAPTVAGDTILIGTSDGEVVAFAAGGCGQATCAPLWEAPVGGVRRRPAPARHLRRPADRVRAPAGLSGGIRAPRPRSGRRRCGR